MGLVGQLIGTLAKVDLNLWLHYLTRSTDIPTRYVQHAVSMLLGMVVSLIQFLQRLFSAQYNAWKVASPDIVAGAWGIGEIAYNDMIAWQRLLDVILPNTVRWLDGHTHRWVDQKYDTEIRILSRWIQSIDVSLAKTRAEVYRILAPGVKSWVSWHRWFDMWPSVVLWTWHGWFQHPGEFAKWATDPLMPRIVGYLSMPQHKRLRDELTQAIVQSTPDMPIQVEAAIVALLNSGNY